MLASSNKNVIFFNLAKAKLDGLKENLGSFMVGSSFSGIKLKQ